jgi:hypothetical protein
MEYLRGQSLRERLRHEGRLPYPAALQLGAQLLLALVHAHEKGVVHRDIKPDNVFLLNQSGVRLLVRVLDFGIARIYRDDMPAVSSTITQPGAVIGTPRYMAPEQLAGDSVDARSDLYSAAVVLFEALTGHVPYTGGQKLIELCPEASPELQFFLECCLQPDRSKRPSSAAEAYLQLHELGKASGALIVSPETLEQLSARYDAHSADSSSNTVTYVPRGIASWSRRRWLFVSGIAVLAIGTAVGIHMNRRPNSGETESLAGVQIGDDRDAVVARLGKPAHPGSDAWSKLPKLFGALLRPEDFGADPNRMELLTWHDGRLGVIVEQNQVRGVIVRAPQPAETGRGVRIGDTERRLKQRYDEPNDLDKEHYEVDESAGHKRTAWGVIYRYASIGLNAVIRDERVSGFALYPPK